MAFQNLNHCLCICTKTAASKSLALPLQQTLAVFERPFRPVVVERELLPPNLLDTHSVFCYCGASSTFFLMLTAKALFLRILLWLFSFRYKRADFWRCWNCDFDCFWTIPQVFGLSVMTWLVTSLFPKLVSSYCLWKRWETVRVTDFTQKQLAEKTALSTFSYLYTHHGLRNSTKSFLKWWAGATRRCRRLFSESPHNQCSVYSISLDYAETQGRKFLWMLPPMTKFNKDQKWIMTKN